MARATGMRGNVARATGMRGNVARATGMRGNVAGMARRGAATGRAWLGGVRQRGMRDWDGCDNEARAAVRGAAMGWATARWGHVSVVVVSSGAW